MLIFELLLFFYMIVNCIIYLIQKWLERQLNDTPNGRKKLYTECEWYKHPTTIKHKIASKLVRIGLPSYAEAEYITFVAVGLLLLTLLVAIFGNAITSPQTN